MSAPPIPRVPRISPEEYLRLERAAEVKSEYIDGTVRAMAGASTSHARLTQNISSLFFNELRGKTCEAMGPDHRVSTPGDRLYAYPDVMVVCNPEYVDNQFDTITNPVVIFEILSPSTEQFDRSIKLNRYQSIPNLRDYVLVSQDQVKVELFSRAVQINRDHWWYRAFENPEDELILDSIDCRLKLSEIYERVQFEAEPAE